jgi:hypothetical protein
MQALQREHGWPRKALWIALGVVLMLGVCTGQVRGQFDAHRWESTTERLPFVPGEALIYGVRVGNLAAGQGTMWIDGPEFVRGVPVLLLRSEMSAGIGPVRGSGRTDSWLDADRMASLRFEKEERRFLSRHREAVDVFPDERRWTADDGRAGTSPTDAPLDELSFIYFIRTLPLLDDSTFSFSRHFEERRNPIAVRVLGRDTVTTPAGTFTTVIVEMRVRDPRHYKGEGVIRLHLTDDECRIPVRIESNVPSVGKTVLTLERVVHPDDHCSMHR